MPKFVCIGAPQFLGKPDENRTEIAEIRATGFVEKIGATYIDIDPEYDTYDDPVVAVNASLAETIQAYPDHFPIVFASDCVSSLGMIKGLSNYKDIGTIWYDAHGDFNTPETTPSGFLGGMPLAILVGRGNQHIMEALNLDPIAENRVMVTDVRDLDEEEGQALFSSDIVVMEDVKELLEKPLPEHPIYIHLDVDIVDPEYMPALGYPADNGPSPDDVVETLRHIAENGNVVGLLVSLWNADKATNDIPINNTLKMIDGLINFLS